jgi:hypothetical protein
VGFQGEVTRVYEPDVGVGDIALEGFSLGRQEERIVLALYREQARPAGAERPVPLMVPGAQDPDDPDRL